MTTATAGAPRPLRDARGRGERVADRRLLASVSDAEAGAARPTRGTRAALRPRRERPRQPTRHGDHLRKGSPGHAGVRASLHTPRAVGLVVSAMSTLPLGAPPAARTRGRVIPNPPRCDSSIRGGPRTADKLGGPCATFSPSPHRGSMVTEQTNVLRSFLAKLRRSRAPVSPDLPDGFISSERDQRLNAASALPPGEHIDVPCIWGVEFYTPAYIDGLESGLERLGWETSSSTTTANPLNRDPIGWLKGLRRHRYGSAALPLDTLTTDESPQFFGSHRVPELPQSAEYAQADIFAIAPSILAVSVCFTIRQGVADAIDKVLREPKTSYAVPRERGYSIRDPYTQKAAAFQARRDVLQREVATWFAEYLPGVFSSSSSRDLPTWKFITTAVGHPVPLGTRSPLWSYLRLIGFTLGLESWVHKRLSGLYLSTTRSQPDHALLIGNRDSLLAEMPSKNVGESVSARDTLVFEVHAALRDVLPSWAVIPLVDLYTRDVVSATVPKHLEPVRTLETLRESMLRRLDVATVASELKDISEEEHWTWSDANSFVRVEHPSSSTTLELGDNLRFIVGNQAG